MSENGNFVGMDLDKNGGSAVNAIIEAIQQDNEEAIVEDFGPFYKVKAPLRMVVKRETIEEILGEDWDMDQMPTQTNTKYEITIEPSGKQIECKEGQTLLDALIRSGIQVAYGCRQGNCSACKAQLRDREKDLIFVAGGSGMAPIKALIEQLFASSFSHQAWFFYGARTPRDLYLVDEWRELEKRYPNFRFIPALSDCPEGEAWDGERGYIADVVSRHMDKMNGMDAYLCGPPILIETTIKVLSEKGVKGSNIYYDEF